MAATNINSLSVSVANDRISGTINDNNTGLGVPLDGYAGYLKAYKVAYDSSETYTTTTATSSITTSGANDITAVADSTWSFVITDDGWYKFKYMAIPDWDVADTYVLNDLAYDVTADATYQCTSGITGGARPASNGSNWVLLTDPITVFSTIGGASEPTNIYYQDFDSILKPNTNKAAGDSAAAAALEATGDTIRKIDVQAFELLSLYVYAMDIANTRYNFVFGEKVARKASNLY